MNSENTVSFYTTTQRSTDFAKFAIFVINHIENYTVPQYGDKGNDIASEYTATYCMSQVEKYLRRFGKNIRPGQELLDLIKMAHYIQITYDKLQEKENVEKF
jgi:hypothetical protein